MRRFFVRGLNEFSRQLLGLMQKLGAVSDGD